MSRQINIGLFCRRRKFKLITDQRAHAYMLDNFRKSKIKNLKIQNWKLELSGYRFDIEYRPGQLILGAYALTRNFNAKKNYGHVNSISIQENLLEKLHKDMGSLDYSIKSKLEIYRTHWLMLLKYAILSIL